MAGILRIILFLFSLAGKASISVTLYSNARRRKHGSMLELSSTRWQSCSSCMEKGSKGPEAIKFQLQDLSDNVDFYMNQFSKTVKERLDSLKASIDPSEMENLKEACEMVEEKIRETQAQIKDSCKNAIEALDKQKDSKSFDGINKRIGESKTMVKAFVEDGVESLSEELNRIRNEFSITPKDIGEKPPKESITEKENESTKSNIETGGNRGETEEKRAAPSLVAVSPNYVNNNMNAEKLGSNHSTGNTEPALTTTTVPETNSQAISEHKTDPPNNHSESKQHLTEAASHDYSDETATLHTADANYDHRDDYERKEGEALDYAATSENMSNDGNKVSELDKNKSYDTKSAVDKRKSGLSISVEAQESFDLAHVPPTAITRAVHSFLQDLNNEASKLLGHMAL
ncbi:hypothetical protein BgAZ_204110 [Babesia gibsoni]|uniref:Uncharacterized protein n=1 Tax=Babesia gibsoni TaxID=33632 RepID=A0AAD8P9F4_BABGI|nr:hypothetical protein BgAZ_204110 [Babesia gibsoni]